MLGRPLRSLRNARKRPKTLLVETSPYGSGQLIVETDSAVSAAYLLDPAGRTRSALWLANHVPAQPQLDRDRIADGLLPPMPAMHTKNQEGRTRPGRKSLEVVWFEEGDGAAILEAGSPLGVLPGGAEAHHGVPGYSRLASGRSPLAWPLDEVRSTALSRIERASAFWRWRASKDGWGNYQATVLAHLQQRLGPAGRYWSADADRLPRLGVVEHPPTPDRPFTVNSTVGMGCQRMPGVERYDPPSGTRIELAIATRRPHGPIIDLLAWLGPYPWRHLTWFPPVHAIAWRDERSLPLGAPWQGALILADPEILFGPRAPDLAGLPAANGHEAVRWLWVVPIRRREYGLAAERGANALVEALALDGRSWVAEL